MLPLMLLTSAYAYDTIGATWPAEAFPVEIHLAQDLGGDLEDSEVEAALQAAIDTWNAVDCTPLELTYAGRATGTFGTEADGQNIVFVLEEGWPDETGLLSTPSLFTSGTALAEADLAINAQYFDWVTEDAQATGPFDMEGTLVHELGHLLGLWHSTVTGASLNPAMSGTAEARSLEDDDIDGICSLYGSLSVGSGELGDACLENEDCLEDLFCLADGDQRYCTSSCEDDGDCLNGYGCYELGNGSLACALVEEPTGCTGCSGAGLASSGLAALVGGLVLFGRRRERSPAA